jgi:flagellar protein FliS
MPTAYLNRSRAAYQRTATMTASQPQLIVMLHDGARRFLKQAATAMAAHDVETAHNKLRRAERIIAHLRSSLDFEQGGEIATNLDAVYSFSLRHLNSARINQDPAMVEQVSDLIGTLRGAWNEVGRKVE